MKTQCIHSYSLGFIRTRHESTRKIKEMPVKCSTRKFRYLVTDSCVWGVVVGIVVHAMCEEIWGNIISHLGEYAISWSFFLFGKPIHADEIQLNLFHAPLALLMVLSLSPPFQLSHCNEHCNQSYITKRLCSIYWLPPLFPLRLWFHAYIYNVVLMKLYYFH